MNSRSGAIQKVAQLIINRQCYHPLRVAIDGMDAAGKTTLVEELALVITANGRPVIRATIDGFHNPKQLRYRQGADSPEGYYQDSFNIKALLSELLIPLGPNGDRNYRQTIFDYRLNSPIHPPRLMAPENAILLFDGIFLMRPELISQWDYRIFVDISFENALARGVERDAQGQTGISKETIKARYLSRYLPGQRLYFEDATPKQKADLIFDNNSIDYPKIVMTEKPTNQQPPTRN